MKAKSAEVLSGKRTLSKAHIRKLSQAFHVPAGIISELAASCSIFRERFDLVAAACVTKLYKSTLRARRS
jgi:hypothetical protein